MFNLNEDQIRGRIRQLQGDVRQQWGKISGDDMSRIKGHADDMLGEAQSRLGSARAKAEHEFADLLDRFRSAPRKTRR